MNNKVKFEMKPLTIFVVGAIIGALVTSVIFLSIDRKTVIDYSNVSSNNNDSSGGNSSSGNQDSTVTEKVYDTGKSEFTVTCSDESTMTFHTPTSMYNLSDQYAEAMTSTYGSISSLSNMVTVGDSATLSQATMMLSAAPLSTTREVLKAINPSMTDEELEGALYSDAYYLMKTGSLPDHKDEENNHNMEVEEIKTETYNGVEWHYYKISYDQEYYTNEEQTETTTIRLTELTVYSNTTDSIEIIAYGSQSESDIDALVDYVDQFLQ